MEAVIWMYISVLVAPVIDHDPGFDWDFCYGQAGVENLCPWSISFGLRYQSWFYLINLSVVTPDSTVIFVLKIIVIGSFHLANLIRFDCAWYILFSWPRIRLGCTLWPRMSWKSLTLEPLIWLSSSELVVLGTFIFNGSGFGWDFCCGPVDVENRVLGFHKPLIRITSIRPTPIRPTNQRSGIHWLGATTD